MEKRSQIQTTSTRLPSIEPSTCTTISGLLFYYRLKRNLGFRIVPTPRFLFPFAKYDMRFMSNYAFCPGVAENKNPTTWKRGRGKTRTNMLNIKMQKKRGMVDDITRKRKPSLTFSTIFSRYMWARSKLRRAKLRENSFRSGASHFGDTKDMQMGD